MSGSNNHSGNSNGYNIGYNNSGDISKTIGSNNNDNNSRFGTIIGIGNWYKENNGLMKDINHLQWD